MPQTASIELLRRQIRRLEQPARHGVVPFGVAAIDRALPGGGLTLGAMHEILGAGGDEEDGALPAAFAATILGRIGKHNGCHAGAPRSGEPGSHEYRLWNMDSGFRSVGGPGMTSVNGDE